jgi:Uma2 family endonuclease
MATFVIDDESVHVPASVTDLASFRRWFHSDAFPEKGRICYLDGEVWIDMSMEPFFSHNQVKTEFTATLCQLARSADLGRYVDDGMLLSNAEADFSVVPDGVFISHDALDTGRVRLIEGKHGGYVKLEGSPDMVLEVVSDSSVTKDTVTLREAYAEAGIREYWLVDARGEKVLFDILRLTAKGYLPTKKVGGWIKSTVFGRSFRLVTGTDRRGDPTYTLEVR